MERRFESVYADSYNLPSPITHNSATPSDPITRTRLQYGTVDEALDKVSVDTRSKRDIIRRLGSLLITHGPGKCRG